jgi:hypothetical protein
MVYVPLLTRFYEILDGNGSVKFMSSTDLNHQKHLARFVLDGCTVVYRP